MDTDAARTPIDDELVDDLLGQMGQFIYAVKSSAAGICAQIPVETSHGELRQLSYAQYRVVVHLWKHGESTVGEIAGGIGVTIATASQLIDKLVDEGWLDRGVNPDDRRQVLITLNDRGSRVSEQIQEIRRAQVRRALAALSPDDIAAAPRVFRAFVGALNAPSAGGQLAPTDEQIALDIVHS